MKKELSTILSNSAFLIIARIITKIATTLFVIILARRVGSENFGVYSSVTAFIAFFSLLEEFGLTQPLIRSIAKEEDDPGKLLGEIILLKIPLGIIAFGLLLSISLLVKLPFLIVILLGISMILEMQAVSITRSFEGKEKMKNVAIITIAERATFCLAGIAIIFMGGGLIGVCMVAIAANLIAIVVGLIMFYKQFCPIKFQLSFNRIKKLMLEALPFFGAAIVSVVYNRADIFILTSFKSSAEVGLYNAAGRIIDAQMFVPMAIVSSVFPALSRQYKIDRNGYNRLFWHSLIFLAILGFSFTIVTWYFSKSIVCLLYSDSFQGSAAMLQTMSMMLVAYYVNFIIGSALIAAGKEIFSTFTLAIGAVISIVVNIILIPQTGGQGASLARVITEVCSFIVQGSIFFLFIHKDYKMFYSRQEL